MGSARSRRSGFWFKPCLAILLTGLADLLFYDQTPGSTVGLFALALILTVLVVHPAVRRDPRARLAISAALLFALTLADAPTLLGWLLFYIALAVAVLSPRANARTDGWSWLHRLLVMMVMSWIAPFVTLVNLEGRRAREFAAAARRLAPLVLPLVGGAIFLALFASANPLIDRTLMGFDLGSADAPRILFWIIALVLVWTFLRPRHLGQTWPTPGDATLNLPGVTSGSITLSLMVFNLLFAVENGLDLTFLWSGARLPKGMTLADYAHRGAYPLIGAALLAGLFVLIALRPGSEAARQPWPRRLVVLWVVQTLLLVASSILRTLDYVQAYSLTRLRIAALIWMGLVGVGLALICWRLLRNRSASWLINANLAAAGLVLAACSVVDLGSVAAEWNIRQAREFGGAGAPLDLCYLGGLGDAALVPLSELETRPLAPNIRDRVATTRTRLLADLTARQDHWRGWTWRGQRRLDRANAIRLGHSVLARAFLDAAACEDIPPLTPAAVGGT